MISPRAYLQSRGNINDEKALPALERSRPSRSSSRKNSSPRIYSNQSLPFPSNLSSERPAPTPVTASGSQSRQGSLRSSTEDDALLLERQSTQPVTIPAKKAVSTDQIPRSVPVRQRSKRNADEQDRAMKPAVAALLATTAIPLPKARPGRLMKANSSMTRRVSIEQLRNEWRKDTSAASSLGNGSPLDFLLEPSDNEDIVHIMASDTMDADDRSFTATSRSVSSESILSTPSLDQDIGTFSSLHSSLLASTPSPRRASKSDRKVCSPPAEKCQEHPLLLVPVSEESTPDTLTPVSSSPSGPGTSMKTGRFKFTSNLTLSLQALRSAAKSFSNFSAPSLPSDDFLTRGFFSASQKYASEMRPRSFDSVPDPAVRRYFNPTPALSSPDFHSMLSDALGSRVVSEHSAMVRNGDASTSTTTAPMIPMQTYSRSNRKPRRPSRGNDEPAPIVAKAMTRQREPRENSDFLRVIVLEMNMRRVGKLDAKSGGRARIWLPPRQALPSPSTPCATSSVGILGTEVQRVVPSRWVSLTLDQHE